MSRTELYRDTKDFLAYASLNAPDFPPGDKVDSAWVLTKLTDNLTQIEALESNEHARRWIALTKAEVIEAFRHYSAGNEEVGCNRISKAEEYLQNAQKRTPIRADFIAGDENFGVRGPMTNG
jgi:hypothetical protein